MMHIYDPDGILHRRQRAKREFKLVALFGAATLVMLVITFYGLHVLLTMAGR